MQHRESADRVSSQDPVKELRRWRAHRSTMMLRSFVTVTGSDAVRPVRLRNLSASGALLETDIRLAPGARLSLEIRGIGQVSGKVVWARGARAGVAFDELVDPALALLTVPVGAGAHSISRALDTDLRDNAD